MDNQKCLKIRLLRSYSRLTIIPTSYNDGCSSASGLERFLPRTSTPDPEKYCYVDDKDCFDPYEIFRHFLENPPKKVRVRGLKTVPFNFISGHLVNLEQREKFDVTTILLGSTYEAQPKKVSMKTRFKRLKKSLKNFFKKCYKNLIRNRCDESVCPVTCECQKVKSLLNKTLCLDDGVNSVEGL